jgi:uncharacterized protein YggE
MKHLAIAALMLLSAFSALAEEKPTPNLVRVTGTSEVKVVPDQGVISIGVEKENASAMAAKHAADSAARNLLTTLRANGLDAKDMATTFLSLQPRTTYVKHVRVSTFVAEQTLSVTVRDISKLDSLLEALVKVGGNRIDSIQYEVSEPRKYRDQAREMAVIAAKEKAQALANALGQQIGKAFSVDEAQDFSSLQSYNSASYGFDSNKVRSREPATAPGERSVTASVTIAFELI